MNGYKYTRIKDDEVEMPLAIAVGLDKETDGLVMVDLIVPKLLGGYRFTARQFDYFTQAVVNAAKIAISMALVVETFSKALEGEDEEVTKRLMQRMGSVLAEYAEDMGGEEAAQDPEEEIPFGEV